MNVTAKTFLTGDFTKLCRLEYSITVAHSGQWNNFTSNKYSKNTLSVVCNKSLWKVKKKFNFQDCMSKNVLANLKTRAQVTKADVHSNFKNSPYKFKQASRQQKLPFLNEQVCGHSSRTIFPCYVKIMNENTILSPLYHLLKCMLCNK